MLPVCIVLHGAMLLFLVYLSTSHMARLFLRRGIFARLYGPDALNGTNRQNDAHWASPFQLPQQLLKGKWCHFILYLLPDSDSITSVYYKHAKLEGFIDDERQFKTAKRSQASGDATVLKRLFRDNFVIFCHRSKRTLLESVNFSTCLYANFQFSWWSGDHSSAPFRGLYLPNAWSQTLQTSKRHTFRVSAFHQYHWFGEIVSCRLCAGQSKGNLKTRKILFLDLALSTLKNSGIFYNSTRHHLHSDGLMLKSRRSIVSI